MSASIDSLIKILKDESGYHAPNYTTGDDTAKHSEDNMEADIPVIDALKIQSKAKKIKGQGAEEKEGEVNTVTAPDGDAVAKMIGRIKTPMADMVVITKGRRGNRKEMSPYLPEKSPEEIHAEEIQAKIAANQAEIDRQYNAIMVRQDALTVQSDQAILDERAEEERQAIESQNRIAAARERAKYEKELTAQGFAIPVDKPVKPQTIYDDKGYLANIVGNQSPDGSVEVIDPQAPAVNRFPPTDQGVAVQISQLMHNKSKYPHPIGANAIRRAMDDFYYKKVKTLSTERAAEYEAAIERLKQLPNFALTHLFYGYLVNRKGNIDPSRMEDEEKRAQEKQAQKEQAEAEREKAIEALTAEHGWRGDANNPYVPTNHEINMMIARLRRGPVSAMAEEKEEYTPEQKKAHRQHIAERLEMLGDFEMDKIETDIPGTRRTLEEYVAGEIDELPEDISRAIGAYNLELYSEHFKDPRTQSAVRMQKAYKAAIEDAYDAFIISAGGVGEKELNKKFKGLPKIMAEYFADDSAVELPSDVLKALSGVLGVDIPELEPFMVYTKQEKAAKKKAEREAVDAKYGDIYKLPPDAIEMAAKPGTYRYVDIVSGQEVTGIKGLITHDEARLNVDANPDGFTIVNEPISRYKRGKKKLDATTGAEETIPILVSLEEQPVFYPDGTVYKSVKSLPVLQDGWTWLRIKNPNTAGGGKNVPVKIATDGDEEGSLTIEEYEPDPDDESVTATGLFYKGKLVNNLYKYLEGGVNESLLDALNEFKVEDESGNVIDFRTLKEAYDTGEYGTDENGELIVSDPTVPRPFAERSIHDKFERYWREKAIHEQAIKDAKEAAKQNKTATFGVDAVFDEYFGDEALFNDPITGEPKTFHRAWYTKDAATMKAYEDKYIKDRKSLYFEDEEKEVTTGRGKNKKTKTVVVEQQIYYMTKSDGSLLPHSFPRMHIEDRDKHVSNIKEEEGYEALMQMLQETAALKLPVSIGGMAFFSKVWPTVYEVSEYMERERNELERYWQEKVRREEVWYKDAATREAYRAEYIKDLESLNSRVAWEKVAIKHSGEYYLKINGKNIRIGHLDRAPMGIGKNGEKIPQAFVIRQCTIDGRGLPQQKVVAMGSNIRALFEDLHDELNSTPTTLDDDGKTRNTSPKWILAHSMNEKKKYAGSIGYSIALAPDHAHELNQARLRKVRDIMYGNDPVYKDKVGMNTEAMAPFRAGIEADYNMVESSISELLPTLPPFLADMSEELQTILPRLSTRNEAGGDRTIDFSGAQAILNKVRVRLLRGLTYGSPLTTRGGFQQKEIDNINRALYDIYDAVGSMQRNYNMATEYLKAMSNITTDERRYLTKFKHKVARREKAHIVHLHRAKMMELEEKLTADGVSYTQNDLTPETYEKEFGDGKYDLEQRKILLSAVLDSVGNPSLLPSRDYIEKLWSESYGETMGPILDELRWPTHKWEDIPYEYMPLAEAIARTFLKPKVLVGKKNMKHREQYNAQLTFNPLTNFTEAEREDAYLHFLAELMLDIHNGMNPDQILEQAGVIHSDDLADVSESAAQTNNSESVAQKVRGGDFYAAREIVRNLPSIWSYKPSEEKERKKLIEKLRGLGKVLMQDPALGEAMRTMFSIREREASRKGNHK